jgi:hypothetical protein
MTEIKAEAENELDARIRNVRAHFLVPASTEEICAELDAAAEPLRPQYQTVVKALRHSLASTLSTVAMPFSLASASIEQSHFQRIHIAERIRARSLDETAVQPGEDLEALRERHAHKKANNRMRDFVESEDGRNALIRDTCGFLLASLKHGLEPAAQELTQQGLVLVWSAFEVFCRDAFEALLNAEPAKIQTLINHPTTRKRFEAERLPLDTLVRYGFDLSARLGSALVGKQEFSDLRTIKAVFAVLFPGRTELTQALAQRDLWMLYQRRHLIVHRRGVMDQDYLDATGESLAIGTRLVVSPRAFETSLGVVVSAGTAVARSLTADGPA